MEASQKVSFRLTIAMMLSFLCVWPIFRHLDGYILRGARILMSFALRICLVYPCPFFTTAG